VILCTQARRWFGAYWDDEITQAERESLETHFAGCATCRGEYEEFARSLEWMAKLPRLDASPDLVERTLARVRRTTSAPDRLRVERPAWVPLAAAATVLLVGVSLLAPWIGSLGRGAAPVATRVAAPLEPQLLPHAGALAASGRVDTRAGAASEAPVSALVDSLIDHSGDVDFVLDPVRVSRGRMVSNPVTGRVQGQQAVITF
jgi:anti-sigma factor RsiW